MEKGDRVKIFPVAAFGRAEMNARRGDHKEERYLSLSVNNILPFVKGGGGDFGKAG
jgi:hypothetical protein